MKNIKQIGLLVSVIVVFVIMVIATVLLQQGESSQDPLFSSQIKAAALTYRRTFTINPPGNLTTAITLTPVITEVMTLPTIFPSPTALSSPSAVLTPTEVPLIVSDLTITPESTLSADGNLPRSGWTQYASVMFIAASVVIFLSFLY